MAAVFRERPSGIQVVVVVVGQEQNAEGLEERIVDCEGGIGGQGSDRPYRRGSPAGIGGGMLENGGKYEIKAT